MKKQICDVIDLISLINTKFEFDQFIDYIKAADIVLLMGHIRVNESNFDTYKSLLESLSTVLFPYFVLISKEEFNPNIFSTDMSKMKIEKLNLLIEKRLSMYDNDFIKQVEELLSSEGVAF